MKLAKLSDADLILKYRSCVKRKERILSEISRRGINHLIDADFKRTIQSAKTIELFMKDCGFDYFASIAKKKARYPSGCCEFHLLVDENVIQVNGEGLSELTSLEDSAIISMFNKKDYEKSIFSKSYATLKQLIQSEQQYFSKLSNWSLAN